MVLSNQTTAGADEFKLYVYDILVGPGAAKYQSYVTPNATTDLNDYRVHNMELLDDGSNYADWWWDNGAASSW